MLCVYEAIQKKSSPYITREFFFNIQFCFFDTFLMFASRRNGNNKRLV